MVWWIEIFPVMPKHVRPLHGTAEMLSIRFFEHSGFDYLADLET